MNKKLTIIGATGHLSTRVVRLLNAKGMELKIVARNPKKARDLFGDSVTIVPGNVEDVESLKEALKGSEAVYVHLNTEAMDPDQQFYTEREGVRNIVEAAEEADVKHLIQIAGIESLRPDFFKAGIIATEEIRRVGMKAIADSKIPHTFLTCSFFLDSLPRFVEHNTFAIFGDATESRIHFTNTDQLAEHLFHVAGNSKSFGQSIPVQGQESLSFPEAAARFFKEFDPNVQVQALPLEVVDSLELPAEVAAFLKHVSEMTAGMREDFIAADAYSVFGNPELSIEQFAKKLKTER